jgi:NAD(P)-dependent dehydrogenase (short-subunit alcohol dehydrogenase family)
MALSFARDGADVGINYRDDRGSAESVAEGVRRQGRRALLVQGDVSKAEDGRAMVATVVRELGGIDILVNNAGMYPRVAERSRVHHPDELRHVCAAIHVKHLAGHVAGVVRRKEHGYVRNVLRVRHSPQRDSPRARLDLFFAITVARLSRIGQTRGDRIDTDPMRSQFQSHGARHRHDTALACRVMDTAYRARYCRGC